MNRIINTILAAGLMLAGLLPVACNKADSPDADPVVRYIRPVDPAMGDKLLTEVSMGSTIAVIGEGLAGVNYIAFNDQVSKLNPTLVTPTSIIVTVPSTMPEEITNKMYVRTSAGKSTEHDLAVIIPSPSVESISCEYAPAGSEVTIYGNYFFPAEDGLVDVVFPGNYEAEVRSVTDTEIVCVVPDEAVNEGEIRVTSAYGTSRSLFTWRNSEGLVLDFEETSWNTWNLSTFASEGGCSGQYMELVGTTASWTWPDNKLQFLYPNPTQKPLLSGEGEVSDYSLCFEYCCESWDDVQMIIWFSTNDTIHNVDSEDAQYHWKQYREGIDKGVWKTIYIPLSEFKVDKEEKTDERSIESFDDMINLSMMFFGGADVIGGDIDVKIDNIRLVKNR